MSTANRTVLLGALLLGFAAGIRGAEPSPEEQDRAKLAAMEAKIDKLIGKAPCHAAGECRAEPFGVKPCGGAWKYKITSATGGKAEAIRQQIDAYNALNAKLNRQYGWMSDCSVVTQPALACSDGHCKVAAAAGAN